MTRRHTTEHHSSQISFLRPEEAEWLHRSRLALAEFVALYEARRTRQLEAAPQIKSPRDAYELLRFEMEHLEQEQLRVLNLNTKHRIISSQLIYQGTINETTVRLAEVFRPAILDNAYELIVAHSHPSGDPEPSPEDVTLTREMVYIGKILGIEILDHIVIGHNRFVSLKERGLGF